MKFSQYFSQLKSHWEVPRDDIVQDLLNPVFEKSDRVDIMAGFYSSSAIRELGYGICELIKNPRGKLRIICSEYLDKKDIPDDSFLHAQKVIDDFMHQLSSGVNLQAGSPVHQYRKFLLNEPDRYAGRRNRRQHSVNNIIKTFNAYTSGQKSEKAFRAAPLTPMPKIVVS